MEWWIKIHKKITEWEWYSDTNTFSLFIHCLLLANRENKKWRWIEIPRGSFIMSLSHLANDTGMSVQNVRTSLLHLKSTNEITYKSTNKFSMITVVWYDKYQSNNWELTNKPTNKLTNNQQSTNNQLTTTKEYKNIRIKEDNINIPFTTFRELYNKKIWDKNKCLKKREKLTDEEREKIISVLPQRITQFTEKQFQPYPETFLNQGRWNDELNAKLNSSFRLL